MAKDNLVRDIDDLDFETEKGSNEIEDLEDISEEELQEIEELVEEPKKAKKSSKKIIPIKTKPKKNKKSRMEDKPKKKKTKSKKKNSNKLLFSLVAVLVVIAILVAAWFTFAPVTNSNGVVAYVNGVAIYEEELNAKYDTVVATSYFPVTKEDVLNSLIEKVLLTEKAEELGIVVTAADAEESLNELIAQRGLTKEQIEQNLEATGLTLDNLLDDFKNFILVDRVANKTFRANMTVENNELVDYLAGKVFVRHILILSDEENQEIYNQLDDIKTELEADNSKFCEYVTSLSQDTGSVSNCGEYFFGAGEMVPEFEKASFDLDVGEFEIVKTTYGYHLIEKLDFDDSVIENAKSSLLSEKADQRYSEFIEELKSKADIEILLTEDVNTETVNETGFEIIPDENVVETEPEVVEVSTGIIDDEEIVSTEPVEEPAIVETESDVVEPEVVEELKPEVIITEPVEETTMVKQVITYYYSETDSKSKELTQMIKDLETQEYIAVEWKCIRVADEDKAICISLYGEYNYELAMSEAKDLGLKYAPTIIFDGHEYVGSYKVEDVRDAICLITGC